ncbi:BTAD domain-containing putative transcriptional regulator [Streptomyces sp. NPDC051956]|uniref:AfsR/SARP family transcriptional regulator n=1 Tax=Streptomyces sp. NPDC051956 TaxID=3365677 RepID=UPI0037CDAE81
MNQTAPPDPSEAAGTPALRIAVLGPLEVHAAGADRTPTAPMARRAMAMLLLSANRLVSVSALIDELWDADPPRLARKTVQTYVYQMRQALKCPVNPCERLETAPGGYRLALRPGELDLWEFEHRVAQARNFLSEGHPREAAKLVREGLGLWRGEPFAGLATGPLLAAQIAQIADSRLGAMELRIEADLQLGRHRDLLGELRRLTVGHPLNEQFAAQLMIAAHRAGQRSTALDAYTQLRGRLVDELGIEPSERLQRLQQDVLSEAPPAAAAPLTQRVEVAGESPHVHSVVDQLPPDSSDFVGREDELARIAARLQASGPKVVTVLGPAGVGKSALAVRAAHRLAPRFPDGLLHVPLHDGNDRPREPAAVLRALLTSAGIARADLPVDPDELAGVFRATVRGRSLLMLLDDAAATDQVLPLLPGGEDSLVLVTSRVRLPGLPGSRALTLDPLTTDDAALFFGGLAGRERTEGDDVTLRQVVGLMGNFPLTLRAVGEKFAARPMWTLADLALGLRDEGQLTAELHDEACDVLARTDGALARLAPPLSRALHLLAAGGAASFGMERAQELLGEDTWHTQSLVGQLLDRHVVVLTGDSPAGVSAFRVPDLIRLSAASHSADLRILPATGRPVTKVLTATG